MTDAQLRHDLSAAISAVIRKHHAVLNLRGTMAVDLAVTTDDLRAEVLVSITRSDIKAAPKLAAPKAKMQQRDPIPPTR